MVFMLKKNKYKNGKKVQSDLYAPPDKGGVWGYANVHHCRQILDENGNVIESYCFSVDDSPVSDPRGIYRKIHKYENGKKVQLDEYALPGKGGILGYANVHHCRRILDKNENIIEQYYFGVDEAPVVDNDGVSNYKLKYENCRIVQADLYALTGKGGVGGNDKVHHSRQILDERENVVEKYYFGVDETRIVDDNGVYVRKYKYENGSRVQNDLYGLPGKGGVWGYAKVHHGRQILDENGNVIEVYYFGVDDTPVADFEGIYHKKNKYENGRKVQRDLYGLPGKGGVWRHPNVHHIRQRFDKDGKVIEEMLFDFNEKELKE